MRNPVLEILHFSFFVIFTWFSKFLINVYLKYVTTDPFKSLILILGGQNVESRVTSKAGLKSNEENKKGIKFQVKIRLVQFWS